MTDMSPEAIRLECVRLAAQSIGALGNSGGDWTDAAVVARAKAFADFVMYCATNAEASADA